MSCNNCGVRLRSLLGAADSKADCLMQKCHDKQHSFSAGDVVHLEQNKIDYAFTVYSGCFILYNNFANGSRQILRVALPGEFVGFSRNSDGFLPYSIKAVTEAKICLFFDPKIEKMANEVPEVAKRLIDLQNNDMVLCQQRLLSLGQKTATESLAYLIMELYSRIKLQAPEFFNPKTKEVLFPLNQADMGDALGLTKVHVNRIIAIFKEEGLISCGHKKINIINKERLSEIGQFDINLIKNPFLHFG